MVREKYDWNNYFNVTEVYGKDNQYYGKCDESGRDGNIVRKQTLSFDSIESNEECKTRAEWENWKARHRHRNLNVTIADNYIKEFKNIAQTLSALINKQKWAEALPYNEAQEIIKDINKDREFLVNNTKDLILVG